jgi:cytochrome c oxidase cbb3-type subunit 4
MSEFNWIGMLGSITTVVAFVAFLAIVAWAYSGRRKAAFDAAANAPFALPDDEIGARGQGRGTAMLGVGPSQGDHSTPSGGSAAAQAASVGAHK